MCYILVSSNLLSYALFILFIDLLIFWFEHDVKENSIAEINESNQDTSDTKAKPRNEELETPTIVT